MSDIKGLREISNDPFGKLLTSLSKKFSAFLAKDQAELVENPEDIYSDGQDVESALKYHNFVMSKQFPVSPTNVEYYSSTEPDGDKVTLMLGTIWLNLGSQMPDKSGYNNDALIWGDPLLIDGAPFDLGIVDATNTTKSIAVKFNRPASSLENREYISVPDCVDLFVSGITTGISYFIRFRLHDLAQQGSVNRTLFEKVDDSTPNNGVAVSVSTTGNLRFHIKRAGTTYSYQTSAGTIATNTVYDVFLTYAVSGNVMHIYVNNVDKSLTGASAPTWHTTLTNHDISIFRRGEGTAGGYTYGDFYSMMLFREKVVSTTEVGRHFTNKITLANIPFGQVAISNYSATSGISLARVSKSMTCKWNVTGTGGGGGGGISFTSTSFTSTSFT